jgi:hypothetical protein
MNSMAASSSHDRVSLIVQGDRAVFALTYMVQITSLLQISLLLVCSMSPTCLTIGPVFACRCSASADISNLCFSFSSSQVHTLHVGTRQQRPNSLFCVISHLSYTISNIQTFVFASFYVTAAAQSHPIGRASVCQLLFGSRLLLFLSSNVRRFVMRHRGFFRQRMHFSRLAAHTCVCNQISVLCLTF